MTSPTFPGDDRDPPPTCFAAGDRVQLRPRVWEAFRVGRSPFGAAGGSPNEPTRDPARYGTVDQVRNVPGPAPGAVAPAMSHPLVYVSHDDGKRRTWEPGALWRLEAGDDPANDPVPVAERLADDDATYLARRRRAKATAAGKTP